MIASIRAKKLLSLVPHRFAIGDEMLPGFHVGEKVEGSLKVTPVPKQRHRLADDIPGRAERRVGSGRFRDMHPSACMVVVFGSRQA